LIMILLIQSIEIEKSQESGSKNLIKTLV